MKKGVLLVALAGVLWGSVSIFTRELRQYGLSPGQMAAIRNCVAAIVLAGLAAAVSPGRFKTCGRELPLFAISGISLAATGSLYYAAMERTSAAVAVVLLYTSPALVMLLSALFLQERLTIGKLGGLLSALAGCGLISGIAGGTRFEPSGVLIGLLSGLAYSIYTISVKIEMRRGNDAVTAVIYCFFFAALTGIIFSSPGQTVALILAQWDGRLFLLMMGLGLLCYTVPYLLYTFAIQRLPAGVAASMSVIEPMTAALLSVLLFGEALSIPAMIGIAAILISAAVLTRDGQEAEKQEKLYVREMRMHSKSRSENM